MCPLGGNIDAQRLTATYAPIVPPREQMEDAMARPHAHDGASDRVWNDNIRIIGMGYSMVFARCDT